MNLKNLKYKLVLAAIFLPIVLNAVTTDSLHIKLDFSATINPPRCFLPFKKCQRPSVGLALSGGGARSMVQLGVLEVLEEHKIPIDFIIGTSMGSVIGGLYAAGYSPQIILNLLKNINWQDIIYDSPPRRNLFLGQKQARDRYILQLRFSNFKPYIPAGLTPGQKISTQLTELTMLAPFGAIPDYDNLEIPFRAVATDLITGQTILLAHGNLADAMCASLAFPLLFSPVKWDSMLLVDGGMTNNIPVEDVQKMGIDITIAIDATSNLRNKDQISLPWEIVDQATTIMQKLKNQSQKQIADIYFRFEMPGYLSTNYLPLDSLVQIGRQSALQQIEAIKALMKERTLEIARQNNPEYAEIFRLNSIEFKGLKNITQARIAQKINPDSLLSAPVSYFGIQQILTRIYSLGYFKDVTGIITTRNNRQTLTIQIEENPKIEAIFFSGNTVFADSTLLQLFSSQPGTVVNFKHSRQDIKRLLKLYRTKGFSLAYIKSIQLNENGSLAIQIMEGKIAQIEIEGNEVSKEFVVLREFPLKVGNIFNYSKVKAGIRNIYSTGLFNTVRLAISQEGRYPKLTLKVNEKKFNLVRIGGHYDDARKGRGFVEILNENLFGLGNSLTFHLQNGDRDQILNLDFRADRIFKSYLTTQINTYCKRQKFLEYNRATKLGEYRETRTGFDFSLGQQIQRLGTISLEVRYNVINTEQLWGTVASTGKLAVHTLALRSIVDTRNQYPFPVSGKYYHFFYEFSSAEILASDLSFFKLYSSLENYTTFFKRHTLHPKVVWGTSDLTTPAAEQFYLGGENNFMGLQERQMRGRQLILAGLEYRFHLPRPFPFEAYLHFSTHLAGIWAKEVDIKVEGFISGVGLKFSVDTPLGPFSLGYGRVKDFREKFYFSAGFDF